MSVAIVGSGGSVVSSVPCVRTPEGCRFEHDSSRHVGVLTSEQYRCCNRKRLWVVMDFKRRCRNIRNEWIGYLL